MQMYVVTDQTLKWQITTGRNTSALVTLMQTNTVQQVEKRTRAHRSYGVSINLVIVTNSPKKQTSIVTHFVRREFFIAGKKLSKSRQHHYLLLSAFRCSRFRFLLAPRQTTQRS